MTGAYPGPYVDGHEPTEDTHVASGPGCVKCKERWPCTVEQMRRTVLAFIADAPKTCGCPDADRTYAELEREFERVAGERDRLNQRWNKALEEGDAQAQRVLQLVEERDTWREAYALAKGLTVEEVIRRHAEQGAPPSTGWHIYLSTGCLHDKHSYCQAMVGYQGEKRPASCKFCGAPCVCWCHPREAS